MNFVEGEILVVDKPLKWTSFDAVNKTRYLLKKHLGIKKIKVGHAGTLDPLATGVVILCTGKKTKQIEQLMDHEKEYIATLKLGETTPSFDLETQVDASYPTEHITRELTERVLREQFTGTIMQVPPVFSAIMVDGKRAYEFARKGAADEVKLSARPVEISSIEIMDFAMPTLTLRIKCSRGTYIRSLARDLGEALDSGAHLTALRRTLVGDYSIDNALSIEQIEELIIKEKTHETV